MNHTGRLISFEGGDGCGKSTQLTLTADWLREQGRDVLETRQPGATALGREIRTLLLSGEFVPVPECELLLFLADRVQHVKAVIQPALNQGKWVLCDRYSDSTLAYQLAARGLAEGTDLKPMLAFAEAGCVPQQTFWLDVPAVLALQRVRTRSKMGEESTRLDEEALSFHERVHAAFVTICQQCPERVVRLDATKDIAVIQQQIQGALV
ncbi:MAG: dTMP kinase [Mariprofundaceae bacterium]|nr:dTMP kinase [Mariprofundaceae bacterium]